MPTDMNSLPMVLFLLAGTAANLPFLVRSLFDVSKSSQLSRSMPAAAPALLTTAFAECCWVLPCLVQCAIQLFNGTEGSWSPSFAKLGCDVMGTYSVFASISGMTSTLWVAIITYRHGAGGKPATRMQSVVVGICCLVGSAIFAFLPLLGVGRYAYTGEGFCYLDWHSPPLAILMLLVTLPTLVAASTLLTLTIRRGSWPSSNDLSLILVAFISAWILWVPASFIGLANASFPKHYMIVGGIFGHAQALINPYLYGTRWRRSALSLGAAPTKEVGMGLEGGKGAAAPASGKVALAVMPTPTTVDVAPASAPPSPPGSECGEPDRVRRAQVAPYVV